MASSSVGVGAASTAARDDVLGQDVVASERARVANRGHLTPPEQPLDPLLGHAPVPHVPRRGLAPLDGIAEVVELGERHGASLAHGVQELDEQVGVLRGCVEHPAPRVVAVHAPPQERMALDRHEGRLVVPVLEHLAAAPQPARQRGSVVRTQAGEERELVAAGEDVHGVDLHQPESAHDPAEVAPIHAAGGSGVVEALRVERDPAGLSDARACRTSGA